jgi:hypothetical protein
LQPDTNVAGLCCTGTHAGDIVSAHIYIDTDSSDREYRTIVISHELGHSLGLADVWDTRFAVTVMYTRQLCSSPARPRPRRKRRYKPSL